MRSDRGMTKAQLLNENRMLRERIEELENRDGACASVPQVPVEEALRRSEESLRALVEGVEFGILVHDSEGKIILANQLARRLLEPWATVLEGKEDPELMWRFFREDGSEMPLEEYPVLRVLRTKEAVTDLLVSVSFPGEDAKRWALVNAAPVFDEDGLLDRVIVSFVEVSELKWAEEKLRRYEHMVSRSTDSIALLDTDFRYLYANTAYLERLGKTREELIGQTPACVFGEEAFHKIIRPRASRCLRGEGFRDQGWLDLPAQGWRHVDVVYSPYLGPNEEVLGYAIFARDDTERALMEEELRQYESMVSCVSDWIGLLDRDSRFLAVNEALTKALGRTREELVGRTAAELFGEKVFRKMVEPNAARCLRGEEVHEQRWLDLPGLGRRHVDVVYSPYLGADGEAVGYAGLGRDDTEREEMRLALRDSEERYRIVLNTMAEAVNIIGKDGRILFVNEGFCRTFGYTRDEAVGMPARNTLRIESRADFDGFVKQIRETGFFSGEGVGVRKDGSEFTMEGRGASLRFGGEDCLLAVVRDVTDRKEAERVLEKRARELAEMHGRLEVRNAELQKALDEIATLRGILPICSYCKKVRSDDGYWQQVDSYITHHTGALVSHGICPECMREHYPELFESGDDSPPSTQSPK